MWQGKKSVKDFVRKVYEDDLISKEDLEECLIAYEKEEENILKILSNNDYINWVVTMLEKNSSVGHRDMDDCYEPNCSISEEDKNDLLLFTNFCEGIFMYLEEHPVKIKRLIINHKETQSVEGRNYITIKYNDCYFDIGYKITKGSWSYCEKATSIDEYVEFNDILNYYSNVINERKKGQGKKLVKENK